MRGGKDGRVRDQRATAQEHVLAICLDRQKRDHPRKLP